MDEINKIDCPLECGARILYFTKHLKKCRNKNKLGKEFKLCPYNSTHIIKANIYQIHIINCKDKPNSESDNDSIDDELEKKCDDSIDDDLEKKCNDSLNDDLKSNDNDIIDNKENINYNNIPNYEKNNLAFNIKFNIKPPKKNKKHKSYLYEKEEEIDSDTLSFFNQVYTNIDMTILKKYIEIPNK